LTETSTQKLKYIIAISVAVATLLVYLPSLRNDFVGVWDDNINIVQNPHIRSLDATFFQWAFLDFHGSNWLPLTWISLAVDYAFWGLNPLGYHLTNLILHALNSLVVVLLIIKLLQTAKARSSEPELLSFLRERTILLVAGATGLLFGLHPVHVESVAWAAERKDLLCALFFLLSIISYTNYVAEGPAETNGKISFGRFLDKRYLFTLGLFVLSLLSKPMAVTLPIVLLILDWYPFNRIQSLTAAWFSFVEKIPFTIVSLASAVITILAQKTGESIVSLVFVPSSSRVLVAVQSLIAYLWKMLLPLNLIPFYPYPKNISLSSVVYLSAIVFMIVITAAAVAAAKRQRLWLSAWGYYVVTLIPVLGIVQVGNQAMADRYTYLPSLGPFLAMGFVIAWIAERVNIFHRSGKILPLIFPVPAICLIFSLSYTTVKQIGIWENSFVLWNHVIEKGFESATAYNNRGLSLDEMGQRDKARADFERAITLDPRNYFAYNNMGVTYGKDGQFQRSIEYFLKAIAINPNHADSYCNLGLTYFFMKQYDDALGNYNQAIHLKRDFDMAYLDRGNLYFTIGNKGLAMADYQKACGLGNSKACEILNLASGE
jgi:tetratricopeptide (TPR) repeat protein